MKKQSIALLAAYAAFVVAGCTSPGTEGQPKTTASGGTVTARGSTFVQPFLSKVFDEYNKKTGFQINYTGGGSSNGIQGVSEGTVPFGACDAPMSDEELAASTVGPILNLPIVLGSIAIVYNVPGVEGHINLDGATLAEIFMTKISKWNDPKIAALNPGVNLPNLAITVQARADGSGSTYVLSDYLSTISPAWSSAMGKSKKLKWDEKVQQWPKSDGVANNTKQTPGSISYVELSWAKKSGLQYAAIKNSAGKYVLPEPAGVSAAAAAAKLPSDYRGSIVNAPGDASYPISSYVFALIPEDLTKQEYGAQVKDALMYVITDGQQFAESLDYAKLPDEVAAGVKEALAKVKVK